MTFSKSCVLLRFFVFLALPMAAAAEELDPDRAYELYQEAFQLLDVELSEAERDVVYGEGDREIKGEAAQRIQEGLKVLAQAASAERVNWPKNKNPDELLPSFEHLALARKATRSGMWYARRIGEKNPDAALGIFHNTLALARHVNEDAVLVSLITSIAIEGITYDAVEDVAGKWDPEHRERFLRIIAEEAPDRSVAEAVEREGHYLLSGLRESLFSAPEGGSLADIMRISSVVILAEETWIGIEHVGLGITFRLKPGETRHGVELVSFDRKRNRATIRSEGGRRWSIFRRGRLSR